MESYLRAHHLESRMLLTQLATGIQNGQLKIKSVNANRDFRITDSEI